MTEKARRLMEAITLAIALAAVGIVASGQATSSTPPVLLSEQKLQIQNVAQRLQIAQLQAQAAQHDFEAAKAELQALLKSLEKDGYTLDLQTFTYLKKSK